MRVRVRMIGARTKGWMRRAQMHLKHPTKPGRGTVAGHSKNDVAPGTLNSILRQAGLKD